MRGARLAALVLLFAGAQPGAASAADDVGAKLEAADACARIAADTERLRCFDGLFGKRHEAGPAAAPAAAPVAAAAPAAATEADFGLTEAQKETAKPEPAEEAQPSNITSRVARVIPRGLEPPVLELENGQQWRLLESMTSVRFRAGDPIVVSRGALGSYLVSHPDRNGAWRAKRIR